MRSLVIIFAIMIAMVGCEPCNATSLDSTLNAVQETANAVTNTLNQSGVAVEEVSTKITDLADLGEFGQTFGFLLGEAKNGILSVADFYSGEVVNYFMVKASFTLIQGLFMLLFIPLIFLLRKIPSFWCDDGDIEKGIGGGGIFVVFVCGVLGIIGFFIGTSGLYDIVMLNAAPKIHITKELADMFAEVSK